ncbi:hypothetical protein Adu01nite_76010 [Paractinoplanes durhamensis]|uniref:WH2 domain-containing protein n=1 Tax=Paractinoplanes durhamensis TaxID=113563 RepID=A0ABQ3Z8U3_9ACTN|nr:hypothetical protein Adu01nite_76010 [Actinoplanes durhamensis]
MVPGGPRRQSGIPLDPTDMPGNGIAEIKQQSREGTVQMKAVPTAPAKNSPNRVAGFNGGGPPEPDLKTFIGHTLGMGTVKSPKPLKTGRFPLSTEPPKIPGRVNGATHAQTLPNSPLTH